VKLPFFTIEVGVGWGANKCMETVYFLT